MDNINTIMLEVFNRYFNALSKLGYVKDNDVDNLLFLVLIEELLTGELSFFISEEDYTFIINSMYCIIGNTCLVDFPIHLTYDSITHPINVEDTRITEDNTTRISEDNHIRVKI